MEKIRGYITFIKKNSEENKKDTYRYVYSKEIRVGDKITIEEIVGKENVTPRDKMIICKKLADSLRHFNLEDWDNLIFLEVETDDYHLSEANFYNYKIPLANSVIIKKIISKEEIYNKILGTTDISIYNVKEFDRFMAGIRLTDKEKEEIIMKIKSKSDVALYNNKLLAGIAFYQDKDEDIYNKLNNNRELVLYPEISGKKERHS